MQEKIPREKLGKMVTEAAVNQFIENQCVLFSSSLPRTLLCLGILMLAFNAVQVLPCCLRPSAGSSAACCLHSRGELHVEWLSTQCSSRKCFGVNLHVKWPQLCT